MERGGRGGGSWKRGEGHEGAGKRRRRQTREWEEARRKEGDQRG